MILHGQIVCEVLMHVYIYDVSVMSCRIYVSTLLSMHTLCSSPLREYVRPKSRLAKQTDVWGTV